ncbi:MAG: nucleotidyl transferase AbiEii/AbiGii toxin family protein [Candidatus Moraniibacteriota bacterium]
MYKEAITKKTQSVLDKLASSSIVKDFYLAGGTALALQFGHRESIDLDWFTEKDFDLGKLKGQLADAGNFEVVSEAPGTLHGILDGVKITFLYYNYPLLFPLIALEDTALSDERDIATMKIDAISSRGSKKDFIDLYFLLKKYTLEEIIGFFEKRYANIRYNKMHILKSLVYFEEAQNEALPVMLQAADWEEIKKVIKEEVNRLVGI